MKFFCFQSNLDLTKSDCSTHEYCNLIKFGQDCTQYKKKSLQGQKVVRTPLLGKIFSLFWLLASRLREFKFIIPAVNVSNNTRIVDAYPRYCPILAFMQKQLSFITFLSLHNTFHLTAYTFKTKKSDNLADFASS